MNHPLAAPIRLVLPASPHFGDATAQRAPRFIQRKSQNLGRKASSSKIWSRDYILDQSIRPEPTGQIRDQRQRTSSNDLLFLDGDVISQIRVGEYLRPETLYRIVSGISDRITFMD
jgi:hypothetical protein